MMEGLPRRKTKIVATLGPASSTREVIRDLILAGIDVARLNFSHGSHEDHAKVLKFVREESEKLGRHVAVMQDLCGPKVRISDVENGSIELVEGSIVLLTHGDHEIGTNQKIFVEAFDPIQVIKPEERVLLSDGKVELFSGKVTGNSVSCKVIAGGTVRSRSGISVPDSKLDIPCLTPKDLGDLAWGVKNAVDYVALSFVATARDVFTLRDQIRELNGECLVISKLERASAIDEISDIIKASDAVMVARGDLGLEIPLERVPHAQQQIIQEANYLGAPVITATQLLMSMVNEVRPTRAEVSDVYTAVRDGTDAVMLSEETAIGKHPVQVVKVLSRILLEAEQDFQFEEYRPRLRGADRETVADAICYAACAAANKVTATAILACTHSGYTARLVAKYRPRQFLVGATYEKKTLARIALLWGVYPLFFQVRDDFLTEDEVVSVMSAAREVYNIKPGSRVVITAGLRAKRPGTTTVMEIREIPRTI
ncbi:pyruvate kinase [bacterium]|nr:pyruvate kinase [bacterium]